MWREPRALVREFGRVGKGGEQRAESFPDEGQAARAYQHQVRRLEGKGYTPARASPSLVAALQADPADPGPYLVYADWLLEQQDVRGELIMRMWKQTAFDDLLAEHAVQLEPLWWKAQKLAVDLAARLRAAGDVAALPRLRASFAGCSSTPRSRCVEELDLVAVPHWHQPHWEQALAHLPPTVKAVRVPQELAPLREPRAAARRGLAFGAAG